MFFGLAKKKEKIEDLLIITKKIQKKIESFHLCNFSKEFQKIALIKRSSKIDPLIYSFFRLN